MSGQDETTEYELFKRASWRNRAPLLVAGAELSITEWWARRRRE